MYRRRPSHGFGYGGAAGRPGGVGHKPLKRPVQARSRFTVQALYDAFVRIWRSRGWDAVTTREVALESGVSVGTLYDYFPNKQALLSGYVRHCIEALVEALHQQVVQADTLTWAERLHRLVRLSCGVDPGQPYFDAEMLALEHQIAEPKHHRRAYEELSAKWVEALTGCADLPRPMSPERARTLFLCAWGGRRYRLLVAPTDLDAERWAAEVEAVCRAAIEAG
ncbi:TetR family transcriptional regulator [Caldimonas brevitalea]|uniref:TetR family transcriptional regulator n=2 Tax=Caldimonas brevitalea TaxID=413882 RepID=A0A0G3BD87_9BURK|nr:TetR family transcriptional regulator [Caldimonas brevitalea]